MKMECVLCSLMVHVEEKEMEHELYYTLMLVKFIIFHTNLNFPALVTLMDLKPCC
jgi:hypothetical protein